MRKIYQRVTEYGTRRLTLDDHGLKYEIGSQTYSLDWNGFDHRIERIGRDTKVSTVILVTRDNKWFAIAAFEDMPGIAAAIRQHVPMSGPQSLWEKVQFHPWYVPSSLMLGFLGMWLIVEKSVALGLSGEQRILIGCICLVPTGISTLYSLPRNPLLKLAQAARRQERGSVARRFFINLAVWIAIVVGVLFILNFIVPRFR